MYYNIFVTYVLTTNFWMVIFMAYAALIMAIIKILFDLFIFIINKINQHENIMQKSKGKLCVYYIETDKRGKCSNILFKRKMANGKCPRENCHGFNIGNTEISNEMLFINIPWLTIVKRIIDLFPEFAAALLALNQLM